MTWDWTHQDTTHHQNREWERRGGLKLIQFCIRSNKNNNFNRLLLLLLRVFSTKPGQDLEPSQIELPQFIEYLFVHTIGRILLGYRKLGKWYEIQNVSTSALKCESNAENILLTIHKRISGWVSKTRKRLTILICLFRTTLKSDKQYLGVTIANNISEIWP